jgi:hypothetical protein
LKRFGQKASLVKKCTRIGDRPIQAYSSVPKIRYYTILYYTNAALQGVSGSAALAFVAVISAVVRAVSTNVAFGAESDLLASAGLKNCSA